MYDTQIQNEVGYKVRELADTDKKPLLACHH